MYIIILTNQHYSRVEYSGGDSFTTLLIKLTLMELFSHGGVTGLVLVLTHMYKRACMPFVCIHTDRHTSTCRFYDQKLNVRTYTVGEAKLLSV